jgi:3,4-dihydroxy 2-butanone 4-phosphate synthase/GTP cyclohydrolase II
MNKDEIKDVIADFKKGKMVIILDDEDRENEGDLICAAEAITPDIVNFMATNGRGLICLALDSEKCEKLNLQPMTNNNKTSNRTAFTVSIEAKDGITTGISAKDRAHTILTAVSANASEDDIVQPGHVFPLQAMKGGVLARAGHTEAACDLACLSGFSAAGVICEIMNDDGTMARRDDLLKFGKKHCLKVGTIADLIDYKLSIESTIENVHTKNVSTEFGEFKLDVWKDVIFDEYHFSLSKGAPEKIDVPMVRVQTQSVLQDTLGIDEIGKKWSIRKSLQKIAEEGAGVFVLINHRDAKTYWLSNLKDENVEPKRNRRVIGIGSQILRALGLSKIKVLGTPTKYSGLSGFNIEIEGFIDE